MAPVLRVKLQEMFGGSTEHFVGATVPLTIELLAPNGRCVARTNDLASFWRDVYPAVRSECRGKYKKHPWPDDPFTATATRATNRQIRAGEEGGGRGGTSRAEKGAREEE